jgi:hypothetical protein
MMVWSKDIDAIYNMSMVVSRKDIDTPGIILVGKNKPDL